MGIDIAKRGFHVIDMDTRGTIILHLLYAPLLTPIASYNILLLQRVVYL